MITIARSAHPAVFTACVRRFDLNANFDERVSVPAARISWKASPMPSVQRRISMPEFDLFDLTIELLRRPAQRH
jgi:hypothetical protein